MFRVCFWEGGGGEGVEFTARPLLRTVSNAVSTV